MVDVIIARHQNSQGVIHNESVIDVQNPKHPLAEEEVTQVLGKLLHVYINRPGHFKVMLIIMPVGNNKTTSPLSQANTNGEITSGRLREILTERELEVLELFVQGLHSHDIAGKLSIDIETVRTHRQHIYNTLGIHSIELLIIQSEKNNWFPS